MCTASDQPALACRADTVACFAADCSRTGAVATARSVCGNTLHGAMEGVHAQVVRLWQEGRLEEADAVFRFLSMYDFTNPEYPMGLAAVCRIRKQYEQAIDLYALAFALDKADYRPILYAGQCHRLLGKPVLANACFERARAHTHDPVLRAQATLCLQAAPATVPAVSAA